MKNIKSVKNKMNKRRKVHIIKERLLTLFLVIMFVLFLIKLFESVFIYPEEHQTTARYHLKLKIDAGDEEAIQYYEDNYVKRGVYLYGEQQ